MFLERVCWSFRGAFNYQGMGPNKDRHEICLFRNGFDQIRANEFTQTEIGMEGDGGETTYFRVSFLNLENGLVVFFAVRVLARERVVDLRQPLCEDEHVLLDASLFFFLNMQDLLHFVSLLPQLLNAYVSSRQRSQNFVLMRNVTVEAAIWTCPFLRRILQEMRYFLLPGCTTENKNQESRLRAFQLLLSLLPCKVRFFSGNVYSLCHWGLVRKVMTIKTVTERGAVAEKSDRKCLSRLLQYGSQR